ncbi:ANTAR domain-containing protein [Lichenihabitans sp. Uapishka_5]|uniref:ANTAR domain-containing response regulator n=1 Tax=Lichenihabitans sp. Uapishka_5 TaxID=3037302 RepID=UPI0029E7FA2B|nr:ANTAR domain-containing protein [Lichenihabitans sp. Uapishka_5]MDX7950595.1 ANTAR domain-containing protein [Lichenihabitans sp. Uapishka_5]
MSGTPNFRGQRAVVLHRPSETTERLARQLTLLGLTVAVRWRPLDHATEADIVLVDADEGWTGLLPWRERDNKPVPLVALLASEAPGRVAWALDQGADALLAKPVTPSAVYPALVMATRRHDEACAAAAVLGELRERLRLRPLVFGAVEGLRAEQGWTEEEAYRHLRGEAMRHRLTLEQCAAALLAAGQGRRA